MMSDTQLPIFSMTQAKDHVKKSVLLPGNFPFRSVEEETKKHIF